MLFLVSFHTRVCRWLTDYAPRVLTQLEFELAASGWWIEHLLPLMPIESSGTCPSSTEIYIQMKYMLTKSSLHIESIWKFTYIYLILFVSFFQVDLHVPLLNSWTCCPRSNEWPHPQQNRQAQDIFLSWLHMRWNLSWLWTEYKAVISIMCRVMNGRIYDEHSKLHKTELCFVTVCSGVAK